MLDLTLSTPFVPGTNLRGDVIGANWSFALPNRELSHAVCLGAPSERWLRMLTRVAQQVTVLCRSGEKPELREGVRVVAGDDLQALPLESGSVDLVAIASARIAKRISGSPRFQADLRRVLSPRGLVYAEGRALSGRRALALLGRELGGAAKFWVTRANHELRTMAADDDAPIVDWLVSSGTCLPSINGSLLLNYRRLLGAHRGNGRDSSTSSASSGRNMRRSTRRRMQGFTRRLVESLLDGAGRLLQPAERPGGLLARHGLFFGKPAGSLLDGPPEYIRAIAAVDGCDISRHRWSLVATGEYSHRKVLFFLFPPKKNAPEFIVKLTRTSELSARLDQEVQALRRLEEADRSLNRTLPRVAFAGRHSGLAVVGETIIRGKPFNAASTFVPECPLAAGAVEWLTSLARVTTTTVPAAHVAEALRTLHQRFAAIYNVPSAHRDYLERQIERVAESTSPFPAVFQHGDPGRWNVLVSGEDVSFIDWEAAELEGMPLWDLFYFIRSFAVGVARSKESADSLPGLGKWLFGSSSLGDRLAAAVERYCSAIDLDGELVEPLFHTCWMHRALKEATRLSPASLSSAHYFNLLKLGIEEREAPTLARIFATSNRRQPQPALQDEA